jgi:hypothetical protein
MIELLSMQYITDARNISGYAGILLVRRTHFVYRAGDVGGIGDFAQHIISSRERLSSSLTGNVRWSSPWKADS